MAAALKGQYTRYQKYFFDIVSLYKKRQDLRLFLEILLSLTAISFFGLFAIRPTFVTIGSLLNQIRSKEELLAQMETKITNLESAQAVYSRELPRISLLDSAIPEAPTPESYVRQLEGLASANNVSLQGLTIGETTLLGRGEIIREDEDVTALPEGAKGISVTMTAAGSYADLASFLTNLENLRRPVLIDVLSFNRLSFESLDSGEFGLVINIAGRVPYITNE